MKKSLAVVALFSATIFVGAETTHQEKSEDFVQLAQRVIPSVVNISSVSTVESPFANGMPNDLFREFFEEYFGEQGAPGAIPPNGMPPQKAMSLGSGFIIDGTGLILTNHHVIANADEIKVSFTESPEEEPTAAIVVGRDPELDVALIQVKTKRRLVPIQFGNSNAVQVGQYVAAIGNPFGQSHSMTHGIISAKGRLSPDLPLLTYFQTDAPINPGNSGGPLVNMHGEVIAINNAIEARAQGIGFAIPINLVMDILPQLKTKGTVTRGYIGILINEMQPEIAKKLNLPENIHAPFVTHVYPNSPAAQAGLRPYDVILNFNEERITSGGELLKEVASIPVGKTAPVTVLRQGKQRPLEIKVRAKPAQNQQAGEAGDEPPSGERKKPENESVGSVIGMELRDLTPEIRAELGLPGNTKGVVVADVLFGGAAFQAGLMPGDLILEVNRQVVDDAATFRSIVNKKGSYLLRIRRPDPRNDDNFAVVVLEIK